MQYVSLIGRLIYGGYFVFSGLNHFRNLKMMSGYAKSKGVPAPALAVAGSGSMVIVGGALVILGWHVPWGAGLIALFLLGVTPMIHNFWAASPEHKQAEIINFTKNLGLFGATLMIASIPYWPFALENP